MAETKKLTPQQQYDLNQVVATMRIDGFEIPKETMPDLEALVKSEITIEEYVRRVKERHHLTGS